MTDQLQQLMALAGPLLKSPQGQQMAQAIMAQMGGGGGADPRAAIAPAAPGGMPQSMPGANPAAPAPMGEEMGNSPSTEDELEMARQQMGGGMEGGHNGMNPDGPTPEEIQMLKTKPTDQNCENFDKLFGDGAAAKVLGGGSYEDDVRGAMDPDEENHKKGIYGRRGRGEPLQGNELDDDD